jgi:hypothetical protein
MELDPDQLLQAERARTAWSECANAVHGALMLQPLRWADALLLIDPLLREVPMRPEDIPETAQHILEAQFESRTDAAGDLAVAMIASYQGIMLLTNTFREPELLVREGRRLNRWIDSLA